MFSTFQIKPAISPKKEITTQSFLQVYQSHQSAATATKSGCIFENANLASFVRSISSKPTTNKSALGKENEEEPAAASLKAEERDWNAMESRIFDYFKDNNVKADTLEQLEHRNLMAARRRLQYKILIENLEASSEESKVCYLLSSCPKLPST